MHLRFAKSGMAMLCGLFIAAASGVAMADPVKDHSDDDHGSSSSSNGNSNKGAKTGYDHDKDGDTDDDQDRTDASTTNIESKTDEADESPEREQEEVRQAVSSGKAAPLTALLRKLRTDYPGQILDVSLGRRSSRLVYVVKYINRAGFVKVVSLDALTLEND